MDDKYSNLNPNVDTRNNLLSLAGFGLALAGFCGIFIAAFILFQPDHLSLSDRYFPSPTATRTPTNTPTPTRTPTPTQTPTPTPNLTATQQVMRSTATAQVIQALATDTINQWPALITDTFDTNENNWVVESRNDEFADMSREINNGKYIWIATAKKGFIGWVSARTSPVSDFNLSVDISRREGTSESDYGLVFREDDEGNFYYFGINNKSFSVVLNYNDHWSDMIKPTTSPFILPNGMNRLTVIAEDSHFIFFINGQFVGELTNKRIAKGRVALAIQIYDAGEKVIFDFDNLELHAP